MIANLSQREKIFLACGAAAIVLLGLWLGVISPYRNAVATAEARIASRERQLEEVRLLQREYRRLQQELTLAERRLVTSTRGFSLFSFIEDVTNRTGVRENLVSMRPQSPQTQGEFREESVEIRLERIRLDQFVRLLHALDSAEIHLNTKNLRIRTRFDDRTQLDATLIVSYLQKAA
ncbi:type II secretion system protein M [Geoalkalibacter halelectricus]|uniref:Type II secretion system protein M n=1 Tax=Geoalkalibacter halelectricus TaxID=2847045 RepID=A0ABY5ZH97_9BACT|nr:type II secretion system protein M [Geoalkalibacter halelectricus]MDO3379661.1 type II secretion system protein M [Geoalkalibacter halelectricus]UWZ78523.1 type II secretion system protein M [Geoalkalibacter halelectricus]